MHRVVITGIAGRMGEELWRVACQEMRVCAGTVRQGGPAAALSAKLAVPVEDSLEAALAHDADVVLDFTLPEATIGHARACADAEVPLVIGTTGLGAEHQAALEEAARRIPVVYAPNTSVGIFLLTELVRQAAAMLGDAFDVEIVEAHHRAKKDAPSGTAWQLARAAAEVLGRDLEIDGCFGRKGETGPRPIREIGVHTIRGGDVVGEHTVYFLGSGERLELTHRASSRETFARGAVRAARWVVGKAPGLYGMKDVLAG